MFSKKMWIVAILIAMAFLVGTSILLPLIIALAIGLIDRAIDLVWSASRRDSPVNLS